MKIRKKQTTNPIAMNIVQLILLVHLSSCNLSDSIKKETQFKFERHKEYIYNINFTGKITKKEFCQKCSHNKYSIKIHIYKPRKNPSISDYQFQPYYYFENDSTLNLTVTKELFYKSKINNRVRKENKSYNLLINNKTIEYLSNKKNQWLP